MTNICNSKECKYKKQIKEDEEIAKELQDRNKTNIGTDFKNQ